MAFCCLCERAVDAWLPYPRAAERSQFMILMETVGSDLSVYGCPHCGWRARSFTTPTRISAISRCGPHGGPTAWRSTS